MTKGIYYIVDADDDGYGFAIVATSIGRAKVIAMKYDIYDDFILMKGHKYKQSAKGLPIGIVDDKKAIELDLYSDPEFDN
jgi:hypothetical protein